MFGLGARKVWEGEGLTLLGHASHWTKTKPEMARNERKTREEESSSQGLLEAGIARKVQINNRQGLWKDSFQTKGALSSSYL